MTDVTDSGILTTGVESAVHRRPRRLLPGAGCAHRRAAVEDESRRRDQQRSDHLSLRQQAVRCDRVRTVAVRVCARRIANCTALRGRSPRRRAVACRSAKPARSLRLLKADMKVLYRSNATLFSLTLSFVIRTEIALAVEMNQGIRSAARARSFIRCATRMRRT